MGISPVSIRYVVLIACLSSGWAFSQSASPLEPVRPDLSGLVQRMAQAYAENKTRVRPYVELRSYDVLKAGEPKSHMIASIDYEPPETKTFRIEQGNGGMAEHVIRKALEKEVELARDPRTAEISEANYRFNLLGTERLANDPCYVLAIEPKRNSKDLLRGKIWVDQNRFLVRRVQGQPAKSSSWWLKSLSVVITYGDLAGMWLQTSSEANAKVRMAGDYRLISRKLDLTPKDDLAATRKARPVTRKNTRIRAIAAESGSYIH